MVTKNELTKTANKYPKKQANSTQTDAKRAPGISRKIPEISPEALNGDPVAPSDTQSIPKGPPRHPKAAKRTSKDLQMSSQGAQIDLQRTPRDALSTHKKLQRIPKIVARTTHQRKFAGPLAHGV